MKSCKPLVSIMYTNIELFQGWAHFDEVMYLLEFYNILQEYVKNWITICLHICVCKQKWINILLKNSVYKQWEIFIAVSTWVHIYHIYYMMVSSIKSTAFNWNA